MGNYIFESNDQTMSVVPPGDYIFEITGIVGSTTKTVQFTLTVLNPCLELPVLVIPGTHFVDKSYLLGDPESNQVWKYTNLVTDNSYVDCGDL